MAIRTKANISAGNALDRLKTGLSLVDTYVEGELKIEASDDWSEEVVIENCIVEYFSGSVTHFEKPVRLMNCHFKICRFVFTHFVNGLIIDNCTFDGYLDFQAGGHNKAGNPIIIANNDFKDFVNFFDCWFEGEISISNNRFHKGTNLLGKPHNIPVTFTMGAMVKDNIGQLHLSSEG